MNSTNKAPEQKVIAGVAGLLAGGTVGAFVLWVLGVVFWGAPAESDTAMDAVPMPVAGFVLAVLAALGSFTAAYTAPHTPRTSDVEQVPLERGPDIPSAHRMD